MNILNHEVLTEKLQKKPNKSYIQKIQQYEGKKPMTLAKFKATGRKMKYKTYMSNYYKRDISLIDMGLGEKILYDIIAGHITAPYTKDSTNQ